MTDTPHLFIEFYSQPVELPAETRKQGRPIFEDQEFVKIQFVGDPKNTLVAPAHSAPSRDRTTGEPITYAQKYPDHYRHFKNNLDQAALSGTPLTEVPWLTAAKREELKALKIFTVEGLAQLDGTALQRIGMGGRELKTQAQAWLDKAAGAALETRLAADNEALRTQIEALQQQMRDMQANFAPFDADGDGKPGGRRRQTAALAPVVAEPGADNDTVSPFDGYEDEDIKAFIADRTGQRPPGNPKRETLIRRAEEIIAAEKAA